MPISAKIIHTMEVKRCRRWTFNKNSCIRGKRERIFGAYCAHDDTVTLNLQRMHEATTAAAPLAPDIPPPARAL